MNQLYPLKFNAILKDKIWGGTRMKTALGKNIADDGKVGESWEISCIEGDISVVANGFLKENDLQELIEVYMGDLVGDKVFDKFGVEFPLLIKFIDANDDLSIQVHPNDEVAKELHQAYGKTEMWYVVDADEGVQLISGFNSEVSKEIYIQHLETGRLLSILNFEPVKAGDVFFIPAGRIHAINAGILVAEIQQTSDITYRIFDYDRVDDAGNPRELHTDLAVDVLDYSRHADYRTNYIEMPNQTVKLASCQYFTTNVLAFDKIIEKDYMSLDSFVIYMCLDGAFTISYDNQSTDLIQKGETVLIPAVLKHLYLQPEKSAKILEVYVE